MELPSELTVTLDPAGLGGRLLDEKRDDGLGAGDDGDALGKNDGETIRLLDRAGDDGLGEVTGETPRLEAEDAWLDGLATELRDTTGLDDREDGPTDELENKLDGEEATGEATTDGRALDEEAKDGLATELGLINRLLDGEPTEDDGDPWGTPGEENRLLGEDRALDEGLGKALDEANGLDDRVLDGLLRKAGLTNWLDDGLGSALEGELATGLLDDGCTLDRALDGELGSKLDGELTVGLTAWLLADDCTLDGELTAGLVNGLPDDGLDWILDGEDAPGDPRLLKGDEGLGDGLTAELWDALGDRDEKILGDGEDTAGDKRLEGETTGEAADDGLDGRLLDGLGETAWLDTPGEAPGLEARLEALETADDGDGLATPPPPGV